MNQKSIFGEAFLDGFTMAGFPDGTTRPGSSEFVVDPGAPEERAAFAFVFEPETRADDVTVTGDLHIVPENALRSMMRRLEEEVYERRKRVLNEAAHGASE